MSRYQSYLNTATSLLGQYHGAQPFADFSKEFFSRDKKYGSTDRKQISHLCYCYFRLGKSFSHLEVAERILTGLFLCSDQPNKILETLRPDWNGLTTAPVEEKHTLVNDDSFRNAEAVLRIFPWVDELSKEIDQPVFDQSFLIQPNLFIRLRPGRESEVKTKLEQAAIYFQEYNPNCLGLANASKIDQVIELNKEAVVQDHNSQRIGEAMQIVKEQTSTAGKLKVWDCCAASGGKSIMAYDILNDIELTVSDIRESIIANLKNRLTAAGIASYKSYVTDLTHSTSKVQQRIAAASAFDLIIADVPCTGSGTWGRTPEQLFYFHDKKIGEYVQKQEAIVRNVVPALNSGGYFLYITCSVFQKENEKMVDLIQKQFSLELIEQQILKGYEMKADTLFFALLKKPA